MCAGQGHLPIRPTLAELQRGIDPLGQRGRKVDDGPGRLPHRPLQDAGGQRIDRFKRRDQPTFARRQHMIGVNHLPDPIEKLDPTRHDPALPGRQETLYVIALGMEKDDLKTCRRILHSDAIWLAFGFGRMMQADQNLDRDGRRGQHITDRFAETAVNTGMGQREQQVARTFDPRSREELGRLGTDPVQRGDLAKQGPKDFRSAAH